MALCPLLNKECIKEECAWWYIDANRKCAIAVLPQLFNNIRQAMSDGLGEVRQEVEGATNTLISWDKNFRRLSTLFGYQAPSSKKQRDD